VGKALFAKRHIVFSLLVISVTILSSPVVQAAAPGGSLFGADAQTPINMVKALTRLFRWGLVFVSIFFFGSAAVSMGSSDGQGKWGWKVAAGLGCLAFPGIYALMELIGRGQDANLDYNVN
jgi:hypothetical protein